MALVNRTRHYLKIENERSCLCTESKIEFRLCVNKNLIIIKKEKTIMNNYPQVREIAIRVVRETELELYKVIAHSVEPRNFPLPQDPNSVEQILYKRFLRLAATQKQRAVAKVLPRLRVSKAKWEAHFGDLSKIDIRSTKPIARQAKGISFTSQFSVPSVTFPMLTALDLSDLTPTPRVSGLKLLLHRVKCIDETNTFGTEWGSDEILLGATTVDEDGETGEIAAAKVGDFDDGDVVAFSPPISYATFNTREGAQYPKSYLVTLALCEEDYGDFPGFLNTLLIETTEKVKKALDEGDSWYERVLHWVVDEVIERFNEWIKDLWEDEIFPPYVVSVQIDSPTFRFDGGKIDSPEQVARFEAHKGMYEITYSWRLRLADLQIGTLQTVP
jgi:hypothetical protein